MDADDSESGREPRHSHRESPTRSARSASGADGADLRGSASERHSSKRRSKRSRDRGLEERRKQTQSRRSKSHHEEMHDSRSSAGAGRGEHSRHHKKRSRSRDAKYDEYMETPVTRVLREVPDDILDTPRPNVYGAQQHAYYGDGDSEHYRIQKGRDCVYVEHYDGFSSIPRHSAFTGHGSDLDKRWFDLNTASSLDVAIAVQKVWIPLTDFCHGLLAGVALMQAIIVDRLIGFSPEETAHFVSFYSNFSLIFTTIFLLLASVCLVSIFDRLDLARGDWPYLMDLFSVRPRIPWLLIPVYICGLILALAAAKGDDWIHLSQYNHSNFTLLKGDLDMLSSWHILNSLRCACVVVGWLLISVSHPPDLLLNLLVDMLSHQNAETKPKIEAGQSASH
ncbi:uncharacterized protein LOC117643306 [Thrips palmi]|uniref:Uncharacterized protein LOC117643306 n=1 Tax=Thrips palmi TaxID=161013 RepID=A0A6P8YMH3_THRPL|nr:uncharacterized protein LOC117643306 [Thrips palmi]